ncbi:sugar ABC transporter permease [Clavibacter michiganensis]|uniref:carbohydrate ABC transporter permease n=1 Tax=Clavibacter michiganensis TaxID=28447 RepID=UPI000A364479|nr:sugar ABC transporter permease [Clavibacter michiganensis]MDO4019719.1 sugar ABC transporter permease [Clavibacter michiganensis]MDO4039384.1 sugar ABC transporter permease [Clavibacter michiganensis]MDO4041424.1 sugar ABC transporter permease [Clavibacter michiganensis]MDO4045726.1 sugar ABC transporter permease [Clavibacter michiganensis]MDO4051769.1 sugar ABC transporter permease [Clavibacter michiganensis]
MALSVDARGTHSDRPATAPASTGSGRSGGAPPPRRARRRDDTRLAAVFLIPASIGLVVFYFWPLLRGIWLSFTSWDLLSPARFIGIENYQRMLADPIFWNAARVTVYYVVLNIGFQTVIALGIAVLMQRLTQSTLLRGVILAPYLVSNVVAALVFLWILDFQLGIGNQLLEWMGLDRIGFFTTEAWVIPTIAAVNVWRHMGYTALLIFAGLQAIPANYYEAARVDGASEFRMFRGITMPLLRPVLGLVLIISVIGSFQVFDTVSVTTGGGPVDASRLLQVYIYDKAFAQFDFGYASTLSVAMLIILVIVTYFQYRITRAGQSDLN